MLCTSWIVEYLTWQPAAGPYMCQAPKRTEMNVLTVVLSCTHLLIDTIQMCSYPNVPFRRNAQNLSSVPGPDRIVYSKWKAKILMILLLSIRDARFKVCFRKPRRNEIAHVKLGDQSLHPDERHYIKNASLHALECRNTKQKPRDMFPTTHVPLSVEPPKERSSSLSARSCCFARSQFVCSTLGIKVLFR